MPRRPQLKTQIAPQIYRLRTGKLEVRVKHKGRLYTAPLYAKDTPLHVMQDWQVKKKTALDTRDLAPLAATPATVAAVPAGAALEARLETFFPQITGRVAFKADRSHLRAWISAVGADGVALGKKTPAAITTADLNVAISAWRTAPPAGAAGQPRALRRIMVAGCTRHGKAIDGYARTTPTTGSNLVVAARTVRHRCRLLHDFFVAEKVPTTELDAAAIPPVPKSVPIGVDVEIVRGVAKKLGKAGDLKAYGRFLVLATTAQRPCQLMKAQPGDVKLDTRVWVVRDAKGGPAHTIALNTDMVKAWRVFIAAKAWGPYDTSQQAILLRRAGWPAGIRPYNARHSVIQDALQDYDLHLDDMQGLAGHMKGETTRQFYAPLALTRQRHISNAINGRMKGVFGPQLVKKKKQG